MNIGIICGSHREKSQSERIGKYIKDVLTLNTPCEQAWLYSLGSNPLPMWREDVWDKKHTWHDQLNNLSKQLRNADGFVIIAPEWNGMVPAGLKNFFLLWHAHEMAHKPAMLVAVSAGMGGSYPIAELRMSSYKNQFLCYMPDHIIVRQIQEVDFTMPVSKPAIKQDQERDIHARINYTLNMLCAYGKALRQVRESGVWNPEDYPTGM